MGQRTEKAGVAIMWTALILLAIILSPILLIAGIILATRALIVELTQECRCMGCGKWIPKKKRTDPLINWCSKDCYLDK